MASVARPAAAPSAAQHADIHAHRVLILDFGAQYTQLIARRVRESHVHDVSITKEAPNYPVS